MNKNDFAHLADSLVNALGLTSTKSFFDTGLGDDGNDVDHWVQALLTLHPGTPIAAAKKIVNDHLDNLLNERINHTRSSRYPADSCPRTRSGTETQHSCPAPSICDQAPTWWEDHCHIYPIVVEYSELQQILSTGEYDVYAKAVSRCQSNPTVYPAWEWRTAGEPLTRAQRADLRKILEIEAPKLRKIETNYRTLAQKRSDLYHILGNYYARIANEAFRRAYGYATSAEDLKSYVIEALGSGIRTYRPETAIPMQAYLRSIVHRRLIDRLRNEGIFTRIERELFRAIDTVHPTWEPYSKVDSATLERIAKSMDQDVDTVKRYLQVYERKLATAHIEYSPGTEDNPGLQIAGTSNIEEEIIAKETQREARDTVLGALGNDIERDIVSAWIAVDGDTDHPDFVEALERHGYKPHSGQVVVNAIIKRAKNSQNRKKTITEA